jgi:hypothetical protein
MVRTCDGRHGVLLPCTFGLICRLRFFLNCSSGQILDLMSGLDVNGHSEHLTSPVGHTFSQLGGLNNTLEHDRQGSNSSYPSPSSTVSPCHEQSPSSLPISRSSELAFALQNEQEQVQSHSCRWMSVCSRLPLFVGHQRR